MPNAKLQQPRCIEPMDRARRRSGPWDVCTSMNWGVRIALLTSDHVATPGQLTLHFSPAPGLDPWHGVPGVVRRASRARLASNREDLLYELLALGRRRRANPWWLQL